jgi:hypothetical protein
MDLGAISVLQAESNGAFGDLVCEIALGPGCVVLYNAKRIEIS